MGHYLRGQRSRGSICASPPWAVRRRCDSHCVSKCPHGSPVGNKRQRDPQMRPLLWHSHVWIRHSTWVVTHTHTPTHTHTHISYVPAHTHTHPYRPLRKWISEVVVCRGFQSDATLSFFYVMSVGFKWRYSMRGMNAYALFSPKSILFLVNRKENLPLRM